MVLVFAAWVLMVVFWRVVVRLIALALVVLVIVGAAAVYQQAAERSDVPPAGKVLVLGS